jgi:hypothetical protein
MAARKLIVSDGRFEQPCGRCGATLTFRKRIRVRNASRIALAGRGSAATDS